MPTPAILMRPQKEEYRSINIDALDAASEHSEM